MFYKKAFIILLILIVPIVLVGCIGEDGGEEITKNSQIQGIIKDYDDESGAAGMVVLKKDGQEVDRLYSEVEWKDGTTKVSKGFQFSNLASGEYTIEIYKLGYETFKRKFTVDSDETKILKNIDLETKEEYPKKDVANIIDYYSTNNDLDNNLKRSLSLTVDREKIHNDLNYGKKIARRILPPQTYGYTSDEFISYDSQKAQDILKDNNIDGKELTVHYSSKGNEEIIDLNKTDWESLNGIKSVSKVPYDDFSNRSPKEHSLTKRGWIIDNPDPLYNLIAIGKYLGFSDEVMNELDKAKLVLDNEDKALEYIYNAEQKAVEQGMFIPIAFSYDKYNE